MQIHTHSPFNLNNDIAYQEWRKIKLANANTNHHLPIITIKKTPPHFYQVSNNNQTLNSQHCSTTQTRLKNDIAIYPENLTDTHFDEIFPINDILSECHKNNYCIYKVADSHLLSTETTKRLIHKLAHACGIRKLDSNICADKDSLTSIYKKNEKNDREYIPYTNKKLSWHTDGYYNPHNKTIYSMLLHCHKPAEHGGESAFVDHELVYILLRDKNPDWIKALSTSKAMTIPANILNNKVIRKEQTGPVFSMTPQGRLHMRYSARTKNIIWQQDKDIQAAKDYIKQLLDTGSPNGLVINRKLKSGEGIITRNILHCRKAFEDDVSHTDHRLFFRGRFYDELPATIKAL